MALPATIDIQSYDKNLTLELRAASSVVLIGANGAGKTRLGAHIDNRLSSSGVDVHRIAAHRSLNLNPNITPPSFEAATNRLLYGHDNGNFNHKLSHRFGNRPETFLLNDFDHLLAALYAENNDISISFRQQSLENINEKIDPPLAKIDNLKAIWHDLLPHRDLIISSNNIKTRSADGTTYSASEMSDGERVIFYLLGQAMIAKPETILIIDEPELHINKSIISRLWDEIESARSDCAFLYITHDVEFAASRHAATKYALRNYRRTPNEAWDIELIPDGNDIPDDIVAAIIGSRRPVLFVEGNSGSLDCTVYRRVYGKFTVIPVGSCDQVIHTVRTFSSRSELHRIGCAGIIDSDGRTESEVAYLSSLGIYTLPVSEIENLFLLPKIFRELAIILRFKEEDISIAIEGLKGEILTKAREHLDNICLRYTKRRIDAEVKKISLAAFDVTQLEKEFTSNVAMIVPASIFQIIKTKLSDAINDGNYEEVLRYYDNKGLLSEVAKRLGYNQKMLEEFIGRALRSDGASELYTALESYLPQIVPRP